MSETNNRIRILLESQPDSWLALSQDESTVVGQGKTYAEAVEGAERNGCDDPVLIKTPTEWVPLVL